VLPLASRNTTDSCSVPRTTMTAVAGLTVTDATGAGRDGPATSPAHASAAHTSALAAAGTVRILDLLVICTAQPYG
jgi:hypothetical protein